MVTPLDGYIDEFFAAVADKSLEIYNEFSLQHELGIHLRSRLSSTEKVQFERPVDYFGLSRAGMPKSEIDISIFTPDQSVKTAVELKFPRNGQYPEQMFAACVDVAFLERLVLGGFCAGWFVMTVDDPRFYSGACDQAPYSYFRGGRTLTGTVQKPTGKENRSISLAGAYRIEWRSAGPVHYARVAVSPASVSPGSLVAATPL